MRRILECVLKLHFPPRISAAHEEGILNSIQVDKKVVRLRQAPESCGVSATSPHEPLSANELATLVKVPGCDSLLIDFSQARFQSQRKPPDPRFIMGSKPQGHEQCCFSLFVANLCLTLGFCRHLIVTCGSLSYDNAHEALPFAIPI